MSTEGYKRSYRGILLIVLKFLYMDSIECYNLILLNDIGGFYYMLYIYYMIDILYALLSPSIY